jgi:hypothetical protein
MHVNSMGNIRRTQGLNCQKISGGLTSAYSLSLPLHTGDSASSTTAGVETDPPRASCLGGGGLSKQLGGSTPQAIQTLGALDHRYTRHHC